MPSVVRAGEADHLARPLAAADGGVLVAARCGSSESISAKACSATASWFVPGAKHTATPWSVAACEIDRVVTDAGAGDHLQARRRGLRDDGARVRLAPGQRRDAAGELREQLLLGHLEFGLDVIAGRVFDREARALRESGRRRGRFP